jgi:hypothetical protein
MLFSLEEPGTKKIEYCWKLGACINISHQIEDARTCASFDDDAWEALLARVIVSGSSETYGGY